jgi:Spy/CpxP family protein refolding chaperone
MSIVRRMVTGVLLFGGLSGAVAAQRPMKGMQPPPPGGGPGGPGQRAGRGAGRAPRLRAQLMRGITLTEAQKVQMRVAQETFRSQAQSLNTQRRVDMLSVQQARLKGDTAAIHAARAKVLTDGDRVVALRAQLTDGFRSNLTPEQQKQFDANKSRVRSQTLRAVRTRQRNMRQGMMRGGGPGGEMMPQRAPGRGRGMMPPPAMDRRLPPRGGDQPPPPV